MVTKRRILLTARDPRAADNVIELVNYIGGTRPDLQIHIYAQDPAFTTIQAKLPKNAIAVVTKVSLPEFERAQKLHRDRSISACADILDHVKPDLIVAGLSGPGLGVDEAMLATCGSQKIPTISLQDDPGWVVDGIAGSAATYVCKTEAAAHDAVGRSRIQKAITVGDWIPPLKRPILTPPASVKTIFFGQPLWHLKGYAAILGDIGRCRLSRSAPTIYQPHPKEKISERRRGAALIRGQLSTLDYKKALALAATHMTCYSTSLQDTARLTGMYFSNCNRIACLWHRDVRHYYSQHSDKSLLNAPIHGDIKIVRHLCDLNKNLDGNPGHLQHVQNHHASYKSAMQNIVAVIDRQLTLSKR